mgnify:CR=1 FL=1
MPRFVIAMDSFKGSLSSMQAGNIVRKALCAHFPGAEAEVVPLADGGEGTLDAIAAAAGGRIVPLRAAGPLGSPVETAYGVIRGDTAVLETANVAGLTMVPEDKRHPYRTTTAGLGELMRAALDAGIRKFVIGLGGSATCDGGIGMLRALGARFRDAEGRELEGFGADLSRLHAVDLAGLDPRLGDCEIIAASDVTNPLCGPQGAAIVFAPQKGASAEEAGLIDRHMARYAAMMEHALGRPLQNVPGAGAAGGLGFALLALGAQIRSGAELILELSGFREKLARADWVITGEGRSDRQTLYGKLPFRVAHMAKAYGVPAILISGSLGEGAGELGKHFAGCFAAVREPASVQECMAQAEPLLYSCADNVFRLLRHAYAARR